MDIKQIRLLNLRSLIAEAGTIARLARLSKTAPAYLSQILNSLPTSTGRPRSVGDKLARKLEQALDKPYGWMDQSHTETELNYSNVPLATTEQLIAAGGTPGGTIESEIQLPVLCSVSQQSFALRVDDDTLSPVLDRDDYVVIDPEKKAEFDDIVLLYENKSDRLLFRLLSTEAGNTVLKAVKADIAPLELDEKTRILGRVVYRCGEL